MPKFKQGRDDKNIGTTLRIPNDDTGLSFLKQLKFYATGGVKIRVRGRGPRVKYAPLLNRTKRSIRQDLPRKHAEYLAVYVDKITERARKMQKAQNDYFNRLYDQAKQVPELQRQMAQLAAEVTAKKIFDMRVPVDVPVRRKFRFDA